MTVEKEVTPVLLVVTGNSLMCCAGLCVKLVPFSDCVSAYCNQSIL